MKVILTSRVAQLGQIGEVIQVKNGYAKNYLIPNKKAIAFTPNSQVLFEAKRSEFEKANQDDLSVASQLKDKIVGKDIIIIESASDDGRLYGSVSSLNIAAKANEIAGSKLLTRANVFLKKPIKEIGVYSVTLELHSDVILDVRLIVTRSESEVEALLKADAKAHSKDVEEEVVVKKSKKTSDADLDIPDDQEVVEEVSEKPAKKAKKKKSEE